MRRSHSRRSDPSTMFAPGIREEPEFSLIVARHDRLVSRPSAKHGT
jgi:hypothetical protein